MLQFKVTPETDREAKVSEPALEASKVTKTFKSSLETDRESNLTKTDELQENHDRPGLDDVQSSELLVTLITNTIST